MVLNRVVEMIERCSGVLNVVLRAILMDVMDGVTAVFVVFYVCVSEAVACMFIFVFFLFFSHKSS
jgi:hypothetical protein